MKELQDNKPAYFAIIPANVRYSNIPPNAKLLYGEITALCNKDGYCWASNSYFADLYGKKKTTISVWVLHLVKCGFIDIDVEYNFKRKIYLKGVLEKSKGGLTENLKGALEKSKQNSTISNTVNNTNNNKKEKDAKASPPPLSEIINFPKQQKWDESELSDFDKQLEEKEEKKVPRKKEEMSAADKQIKSRVGLAQFRFVKANDELLKTVPLWVVDNLLEWMEHKKDIKDSMKKVKTVTTLINRIVKEGEKRTREVLDYCTIDHEYKGLIWTFGKDKKTYKNGTSKIPVKRIDSYEKYYNQ